jgi:hypothetical protein
MAIPSLLQVVIAETPAELLARLTEIPSDPFGAKEGRQVLLQEQPTAFPRPRSGDLLQEQPTAFPRPRSGDMPLCTFHPRSLPQTLYTALPQLVDVFAELNGHNVYFVGLNQKQCLREQASMSTRFDSLGNILPHFYGNRYQCSFYKSLSGRVLATTESDQIASTDDVIVFHCSVPIELRELAMNTVNKAKLVVTVRLLSSPGVDVADLHTDTWEQLPVCSHPIVNTKNQVSSLRPSQYYLSACLYATGDPYWVS